MSSSEESQLASSKLPLRKIPGDCGLPFLGAMKDRYSYYYTQGREEFFKSRMQKYQSTVFRSNMPPGPFISPNPKVIILLDSVSFSVLFDHTKVEKKDVLDGTYMPSLDFTGGFRTCAYLDVSEPNHAKLKRLFITMLSSLHQNFIPETQKCFDELFINVETQITRKGAADFNTLSDNMSFDLVCRLFFNINPSETKLGSDGSNLVTKWLLFQLHPLITLGLPKVFCVLEDLLFHTFHFPYFLVKNDYKKIYDVIHGSATTVGLLDEAEKLGLSRDEACHNIVFMAGFNAFGGMKALFPCIMKWIGLGGEKLHKQLVNEIRSVCKSEGLISFGQIEKMALTKSVVYEALRIEPPVPFQYARAKKDFVIESHDACFDVKKGEMLFGFQPYATKDPKVFVNPDEFVASRFMGVDGEKLLNYVYWSNGRETETPSEENKQCPAKDLVILMCRVMITEFFLRYDTFTFELGTLPLGSSVKVKSMTRATSNYGATTSA